VTHLAAFALCLAGFAALAFATDHQQAVLPRPLPASMRRGVRVAGSCALLAALMVLVARQGWALGLVMFSGHTSVTAGFVYLALIGFSRRSQRPSAPVRAS
jgi:hypothetical protein